MLWLIIIASILGFLSVEYLAKLPQFNTLEPHYWISFSAAMMVIMVIIWLYNYRYQKKRNRDHSSPAYYKECAIYLSIFVVTILASSSLGLYQTARYHASLISTSQTIEATIEATQITDTVAEPVKFAGRTILVGNDYARAVWRIVAVTPDTATHTTTITVPMTVLVSAEIASHPEWATTLSRLQPQQRLKVKLALKPIMQREEQSLPKNAQPIALGFDEPMWLRQRGVQAKAYLVDIDKNSLSDNSLNALDITSAVEQLRWQLRQKILTQLKQRLSQQTSNQQLTYPQHMSEQDSGANQQLIDTYAILLGLLTGDKSLMSSDIKNLYQVTGISHLLAISGPHVLMLASMVSLWILAFIKAFCPTILRRMPSTLLILWMSVAIAGFYALLVGFELPAQRTFWMLLLLTLSRQWLIDTSTIRLLGWVGLCMMWVDTTAVLQAGFWLSFVAVALLLDFSECFAETKNLDMSEVISHNNSMNITQRFGLFIRLMGEGVVNLLKMQVWLFMGMAPIVLWFFGKLSLISLLTNLVAVPLLGIIVVPFDMLAGVLSYFPTIGYWLSRGIWTLLSSILGYFHQLLTYLVTVGFAKQWYLGISHAQLVIAAIAMLIYFCRGVIPRALLLPLFVIIVILPIRQQQLSDTQPILAVLEDDKISVSLLVKGKVAWLILADNQALVQVNDRPKTMKFAQKKVVSSKTDNNTSQFLDRKIYPLLAKYHVNKLTGVISQTPSYPVNDLIQSLVTTIPTEHYWQAGAEVIPTPITTQSKQFQYPMITPNSCQSGQKWQDSVISLIAITGWQLDLPLDNQERIETQACFIQIDYDQPNAKNYQVVIAAGQSELPLQMNQKLCQLTKTDLYIQPSRIPINNDWLSELQPTLIHLLANINAKPSEQSQIALMQWQEQTPNSPHQLIQSGRVGNVAYKLGQ